MAVYPKLNKSRSCTLSCQKHKFVHFYLSFFYLDLKGLRLTYSPIISHTHTQRNQVPNISALIRLERSLSFYMKTSLLKAVNMCKLSVCHSGNNFVKSWYRLYMDISLFISFITVFDKISAYVSFYFCNFLS